MGFGNYEICDLWDFGIMGEGGRRGAKQRGEKGRARALVHHPWRKVSILPLLSLSKILATFLFSFVFLWLVEFLEKSSFVWSWL